MTRKEFRALLVKNDACKDGIKRFDKKKGPLLKVLRWYVENNRRWWMGDLPRRRDWRWLLNADYYRNKTTDKLSQIAVRIEAGSVP